jgi:predicted nucleotidyltransferase
MTTTFIEPIGVNQELNPSLWTNNQLKPEVRLALLRIAREFYKFLEVEAKIHDIVISGSQANYNYGPLSDIDLHVIIPISSIKCDEPIEALFDTKRKLWKVKHTIDIYGIPVEAYAEDQYRPAVSSVYSVLNDRWVKHPGTPIIDYNRARVERLVQAWTKLIDHALVDSREDQLTGLTQMLMNYRKLSLAKDGEFGPGNLAFKSLRNAGTLDRLHTALNTIKDSNLSLD